VFNSAVMKGIYVAGAVLLFVLLAVPVKAGSHQGPGSGEYIIGKGDLLEIVVWQEPELSRQVRVRVDGRISIPLADDVSAAGKTPMELKEAVTQRLAQYIEAPEVTVIVQEQFIRPQYYILGEVRQQGEFELDRDLTVLQALAKSQGFSDWADKRNILLLRKEGDREQRININYRDIVSGSAPGQNVQLKPGDTLVVP